MPGQKYHFHSSVETHIHTSEKIMHIVCLDYLTSFSLYVIFTQTITLNSKPIRIALAMRKEHQGAAFPTHGAAGVPGGCGPRRDKGLCPHLDSPQDTEGQKTLPLHGKPSAIACSGPQVCSFPQSPDLGLHTSPGCCAMSKVTGMHQGFI